MWRQKSSGCDHKICLLMWCTFSGLTKVCFSKNIQTNPIEPNQVLFIHKTPNHIHHLSQFYSLHSERLPPSSDPREEWGQRHTHKHAAACFSDPGGQVLLQPLDQTPEASLPSSCFALCHLTHEETDLPLDTTCESHDAHSSAFSSHHKRSSGARWVHGVLDCEELRLWAFWSWHPVRWRPVPRRLQQCPESTAACNECTPICNDWVITLFAVSTLF